MNEPSRTRSVLIVADGIVGLAAAIALRRALPDAAVTLVQLPPDPNGWIDRLGAVSPVIHRFHRQIGLDARQFIRRAQAEPVHLRRYVAADGSEIREASTAAIPFLEGVPLHQIWLRHRAESDGTKPDFAALLLALREARGDEGGFGARYDPAAYRALLSDMTTTLNIAQHDTTGVEVVAKASAIARVLTAEGEALTADLYIDAAGPRSRLLKALEIEWRDWSGVLPSQALTVDEDGEGGSREETLTRTADALVWQNCRWRARLSPDATALSPGRLEQVFVANTVAIGEAAVRAPTTDGIALGIALEDILRLTTLLPRPNGGDREATEYERRALIAYDALADWSGLSLSPADAPLAAALTDMLATFAARGRVAPRELDPIQPGQWLARLMALAPTPHRVDPTALALPETIVRATIARAG